MDLKPVLPLEEAKWLASKQTMQLFDRLLQLLDDENTTLSVIEEHLKLRAKLNGVNYASFAHMEPYLGDEDNEAQIESAKAKVNSGSEFQSKPEAERCILLNELHRQLRLSSHYESLIAKFEIVLAHTLHYTSEFIQKSAQQCQAQDLAIRSRMSSLQKSLETLQHINKVKSRDIQKSLALIEKQSKELSI
ncbi:hypothetical protein DAMA08_014710 [Martiniozyma asiatica (nom. inval.)]|nr:hypothetical protein DAMA08_014710 [Martiniozyma asiatica]